MEKIKFLLELTVETDGETIEVGVYEPESGDFTRITNGFSPDEHPEFDADIGAEIYSWACLKADELAKMNGQ